MHGALCIQSMSIYNFIIFNEFFHFAIVIALCIAVWIMHKQTLAERVCDDKMFREIAERSFDTIFLTDIAGNLTYISPSAEKTFLRKDSEALGKQINVFIKEPEKKRVAELFDTVLKKGHLEGVEMKMIRGDGTLIDMEVNASVIKKNGKPEGLQGVMHNITKRKEMEKKLGERNEELEKINKLMVGREMRIIELKKEVEALKKET
jgi:PAS domain S-box-containing protein